MKEEELRIILELLRNYSTMINTQIAKKYGKNFDNILITEDTLNLAKKNLASITGLKEEIIANIDLFKYLYNANGLVELIIILKSLNKVQELTIEDAKNIEQIHLNLPSFSSYILKRKDAKEIIKSLSKEGSKTFTNAFTMEPTYRDFLLKSLELFYLTLINIPLKTLYIEEKDKYENMYFHIRKENRMKQTEHKTKGETLKGPYIKDRKRFIAESKMDLYEYRDLLLLCKEKITWEDYLQTFERGSKVLMFPVSDENGNYKKAFCNYFAAKYGFQYNTINLLSTIRNDIDLINIYLVLKALRIVTDVDYIFLDRILFAKYCSFNTLIGIISTICDEEENLNFDDVMVLLRNASEDAFRLATTLNGEEKDTLVFASEQLHYQKNDLGYTKITYKEWFNEIKGKRVK